MTVTVKTARRWRTDDAVGITFRDPQLPRAQWLTPSGHTTNRIVHACLWWAYRPGYSTRPLFVAATIARNFPGSTVTVRTPGGKILATFRHHGPARQSAAEIMADIRANSPALQD